MKNKSTLLDFVIDRLTNSIRNTISGDSFTTEVLRLTNADLKGITKKAGWNFNWKAELADNTREVFKLTITNNPRIIQGLLSLIMCTCTCWKMHLSILGMASFMKVWQEI